MFVKASFMTSKRAYSYRVLDNFDPDYQYWFVNSPTGNRKIVRVVEICDDIDYNPIKGYEKIEHLKAILQPVDFFLEREYNINNPEALEKLDQGFDEYAKYYNEVISE
jgi:hypothetical protein